MFWIIAIVVIAILIVLYLKSYKLDIYRTITAYTGGVGAGKTCLAVRQAIKCYKRALKQWKRQRIKAILRRREVPEKPMLYSNIPIHYKKKFSSCEVTPEILLLQERVEEGSVILIDEVSAFLNQFEYSKNSNVKLFDEFCRLCRQYFNGNVIITDQCSSNVVLQIRRRLNTIYNLSKHAYFFGITRVRVREINISDEIVSIDEKDTNEQQKNFFCIGRWFKYYDSRCYSERYQVLELNHAAHHAEFKTNMLLTCPDKLYDNVIEGKLHPADVSDETVPTVSATPKVSGNVEDFESLFGDGDGYL